jgi:hypothetical protein
MVFALIEKEWLTAVTSTIVFFLSSMWGLLVTIGTSSRSCVLLPHARAARPGFFVRKRDDILLAIVSALVGALITLLVSHL